MAVLPRIGRGEHGIPACLLQPAHNLYRFTSKVPLGINDLVTIGC